VVTWEEPPADPASPPALDEPEPFVTRALETLAVPRSTPVLDVACGGGRHLLWLERHGFAAFGTDPDAACLRHARAVLEREARAVRVAVADARELPFAGGRFGAVIAHRALDRGPAADVRRAVTEVARVLRHEGVFVGTLLSTRTWERDAAGASVARHFCDEAAARDLLGAFDVDGLALDEYSDDEGRRHSHWRFVAIRGRSAPSCERRP